MAGKFVPTCLLFFALIGVSYAIKCYVCAGNNCPKDGYNRPASDLSADVCTKCAKVETKVGQTVSTARTCVPVCPPSVGSAVTSYCCDKSECNSATFFRPSMQTMLLSVGASLYAWYKFAAPR